MAAPNIKNPTSIYGRTVYIAPTGTDMTELISNAADSGKVCKINLILVTNVDGSSAADISIDFFTQDDIGGTGYALAATISVPPDASLVVIDKNTPIYLEEDRSIGCQASAGGDLEVTCSYEEIS